MGLADPSGFAAMACDEMLIDTDHAARGLAVEFRPPPELAERVSRRLFPWVTPSDVELGDQGQLSSWAWHCAPLDEWDGTVPDQPTAQPGS